MYTIYFAQDFGYYTWEENWNDGSRYRSAMTTTEANREVEAGRAKFSSR